MKYPRGTKHIFMMKRIFTICCLVLLTLSLSAQTEDIVLPEGMQQQAMDSLLHDWTLRHHLHKEESCQPTGENPFFAPEVYASRLKRLPNVIPMPYNAVVRQYIDHYCERMRTSVSIILASQNFYIPIFEQALESYQLPLELKYLPVIESALKPEATSRVGAAGLWQFMIATGKQYGLEVTSLVDERRDPIKASYAAAHYLKDLYDIFHDWTLVIASYNCGPANVSKAIKRAGGETDYWAIYNYLPRETQGYVPAFIAANYIMQYYCDHNICPMTASLPQATDTLMVNRHLRMDFIAQACQMDIEELKALNPQYRTPLIPGEARPCTLRLPADKVGTYLEMGDSIAAMQDAHEAVSRPVVEVAVTAKAGKPSRGKGGKTVTVRKGDTLGAIARRNGTTVQKLRALNGLSGNNIQVGKKLKVN